MTFDYLIPDVGEGIAEVEILRWFAEVGDWIEADSILVETETDKSVVEIPAPVSGLLLRRCVEVGDRAAVGDLLAVIGDDKESPAAAAEPTVQKPTTPAPGAATSGSGGKTAAGHYLASPHTRRLAARRGIDLATIVGTGPHGRILESDLESTGPAQSAAVPPMPTPPAVTPTRAQTRGLGTRERTSTTTALTGIRRATADSMTQALTIPHITEFREIDASNLLAARAALKDRFTARGQALSVFPLMVAAVARALTEQPSFNATFDAAAGTTTSYSAVDIGIATATDDGLLVPVIRDADQRGLIGLTAEISRLTDGARSRSLTRDELTGGTFTITNFGSFGTWLGQPLIHPPEVAIAGFGRITDRVVPVHGDVQIRPMLPIVIAADHRIHDGVHVAAFIDAIAEVIRQPLVLLT